MGTLFRKECKRTRKGLLIWSLIIGLTSYLGILEYPVLAPYGAQLTETMSLIPKIAQLVFGVYHVNMGDTLGYYVVMYYWCGLIVFAHAMYIGASMMSKEQRDKTAEFLFTKPLKRSHILTAKIGAGFVNIVVVGGVTLLMSLAALVPMPDGALIAGKVILCGVGMFFTQCVLMALGFLCSAVGRTYKSGVILAAAVLAVSYCLMFLIQYLELPALFFLSPLTFFEVTGVLAGGIGIGYLVLAIVLISACFFFSNRLYRRKAMII